MDRKRVAILVFDDVEVLDACGPFEVFSIARLDESRRLEDPSPFEVVLVAERLDPVVACGGLRLTPNFTLDTCPPIDVLVVPGGWGTRREMHNDALLTWIGMTGRAVETLTSVCTGSLLLGRAGLLEDRRATTHWRALDLLREHCPDTHVVDDEHVVIDGRVLTSAGVSAGIDMALHVVTRYWGERIGRNTARAMEYPYPDDNSRRV